MSFLSHAFPPPDRVAIVRVGDDVRYWPPKIQLMLVVDSIGTGPGYFDPDLPALLVTGSGGDVYTGCAADWSAAEIALIAARHRRAAVVITTDYAFPKWAAAVPCARRAGEAVTHLNPLVAIVQNTMRYDAELLRKFGPLKVSDSDSFALLSALWHLWPSDNFDETNIAVEAPYDRRLWRALEFLGPLRKRRGGSGMMLSRKNERDTLRWIIAVADREIGGLRLDRCSSGWCDIIRVEARP